MPTVPHWPTDHPCDLTFRKQPDADGDRRPTLKVVTDSASLAPPLDEYVAWFFENHPIAASTLGAEGFDDRLGDFSAVGFQAREAGTDRWLERFEAVDGDLGLDDGIDRDLVVAMLRGDRLMADWPLWRRDPAAYLAPVFTALYVPFLYRLRPDEQLVRSTVARLRQVPEVLAACRTNLDPELASPLLVQRGHRQAQAGRGFLTEALPAEVNDEALRDQLRAAAEPAAQAFDDTAAFLVGLADRATGDWRIGERRYSALLRERELLDVDAAELHRRGLDVWAELDAEMSELASRVDGGSSDWRTVIDRLADDYPPTLEAMCDEYDTETRRARKFLLENDLVSFADGETCLVVPSPAFQRPILAVAFYAAPPPLTASRLGHFFVPYTPDDYSPEQVRQRLRSNARAQLPTTSVHEAYPGHHWHLSWMASTPRTVRTFFRSAYFAEGWALYAEKMMREQGYFATAEHELAHLEARIFRATRIVVDTALHTGEMTVEQAEEFMATKGTLNLETAKAEVDRYCAWPTQAPSYLTGCLEIERIRTDYLSAGRGGLRDFHDQLAGSGSLPLGLARRAVMGA
jgi:uncharacterized protein (DUF885 family)